jgi:hypothetical protein
MKTIIKLAAAFAVATAAVASPAYADKPAELSASELAALQAHNYKVPAEVAFKSVVATLQSLGYVDINASRDAGTISAVTEAKAKIIYNILWGFGKKKLTQKASLLVEDNGPAGSMVRLNLMVSQTKARGIFGTSFSDGQIVKTAEPYSQFFTALDSDIADRALRYVPAPAVPAQAPAATAPMATAAAVAAAPSAPAQPTPTGAVGPATTPHSNK